MPEELAGLAADPALLKGTPWESKSGAVSGLSARIPPRMCASVTLSTMHGCPPGEIESICSYMLTEKKLDTLVKLNPTLLGHERARARSTMRRSAARWASSSRPEPRPKLVTVDYAAMSKAMSDLNNWWLKNIQHS